MNQKRTNKNTSTTRSQSNSKTSEKKTTARKSKNKVSSNTALFLSLVVLLLCVVMLAISFAFTQKATSTPSSVPVVAKENTSSNVKSNATTSNSVSIEKEKSPSVKTQTKETSSKTKVTSSSSKQTEKTQSTKNQAVKTETPKTTVTNKTTQQSSTQKTATPKSSVQNSVSKSASVQITQNKVESKENIVTPTKKVADIYIVLDDGGHNLSHLKPFLDLKIPLTIAVLPNLAYSKQSANLTVQYGKTLILHQPMQAINLSTDPGPNAIMPQMSADQIRSLVSENLDSLGVKIGLNNHEGSLITADTYAMKAVMEVCKSRGMFFLDSRTNSQSVCKSVASEYGVKLYERNIFLDNTPNQDDMIAMFKSGIEIAKKNGSVVMIGHVWSGKNLADVLQKMYDEFTPQGFIFGELK